jgi:hypothetical protein
VAGYLVFNEIVGVMNFNRSLNVACKLHFVKKIIMENNGEHAGMWLGCLTCWSRVRLCVCIGSAYGVAGQAD